MKKLTVGQLRKAMREHPYLMIQEDYWSYAVNSKVINLAKMKSADDSTVTNVISYRPINFQEYISHKTFF